MCKASASALRLKQVHRPYSAIPSVTLADMLRSRRLPNGRRKFELFGAGMTIRRHRSRLHFLMQFQIHRRC
ncbi:hypothetical protein AM571_CH00324 [Rhizobium etli 8C-3]|uniref:Uncharacterized protein n=1 Tax=Rhizobium etli 8C-3 TaxID=538025 RepID=A0A1L5NZA9_RHIET|nr:hypothetical protein AM571_CH00324 [Rhizobium etli 8C-3]